MNGGLSAKNRLRFLASLCKAEAFIFKRLDKPLFRQNINFAMLR